MARQRRNYLPPVTKWVSADCEDFFQTSFSGFGDGGWLGMPRRFLPVTVGELEADNALWNAPDSPWNAQESIWTESAGQTQ